MHFCGYGFGNSLSSDLSVVDRVLGEDLGKEACCLWRTASASVDPRCKDWCPSLANMSLIADCCAGRWQYRRSLRCSHGCRRIQNSFGRPYTLYCTSHSKSPALTALLLLFQCSWVAGLCGFARLGLSFGLCFESQYYEFSHYSPYSFVAHMGRGCRWSLASGRLSCWPLKSICRRPGGICFSAACSCGRNHNRLITTNLRLPYS